MMVYHYIFDQHHFFMIVNSVNWINPIYSVNPVYSVNPIYLVN